MPASVGPANIGPSDADRDFLVNYVVEDHASDTLSKLNDEWAKSETLVRSAQRTLNNYEQQVAVTNQKQADMGVTIGIVAGIVTSFTTVAIQKISKLTSEIINFAEASMEVRKRLDVLDVAMLNVGKNAGYTAGQMKEFENAVEEKGISIEATRTVLTKMAQAEIDLSKASQLATVAADASVSAHMSESQALETITNAIERQSPLMLKRMGLNISMAAAEQVYAASIGKTTSELNDVEKKQALVNAILKAGILIAGTYAATTKTVAQAQEETGLVIERLQNKLGALFQPAYFAQITTYNNLLKEFDKFLTDNADEIDILSKELADLFTAATLLAQPFITIIGDIFKLIADGILDVRDFEIALAGMFGEEAKTAVKDYYDRLFNVNAILTTITKLALLTGGAFAGMEERTRVIAEQFISVANLAAALASGDMKKIQDAANALDSAKRDFLGKDDTAWQATAKYLKDAVDQMPGLVNGYRDLGKAAGEAAGASASATQKLADAIVQAGMKLQELKDKLVDQEIDRQIKLQRSVIEDQIKEQWAAEDRERAHTDRLNDIFKNAEDQKSRVLQQVSEQKVQIETDYRKRLQEIQRNFELDAAEFARKRDAVGLLALIRQNKRQLDNEKRAHDDNKKQVDERYKKALADIDKSMQDQLKKLEEAYDKELETYQRNLDRQKVLKDLYNQWEQEDRNRAQRKALADVVKFYYGLDGATKKGLGDLLKDWGNYFTQIDEALVQYNDRLSNWGPGPGSNDAQIKIMERLQNKDLNGDGVIGQAGLVSQMLAPTFLTPTMAGGAASRVPAVRPSTNSNGVREIKLSGDVSGMDPYIQRVMVNALLEIERNRG